MTIEQQNPDFCYFKEEYNNFVRNSFNSRYSYFRQNYYTAGDFEQFIRRWKNLPRNEERNTSLYNEIGTIQIGNFFQNELCIHDYYNTFQYINEKFKKGCFLQIHTNELKTYIPFSCQSFKNEWGESLKIDPRFGSISNLMKYLSEIDDTFPFDERRINRDMTKWYGNNGLVRFEYPLTENDNGYNILKDMFVTLVKERDVPDVDFFLNKRDYPILRKDGNESYDVFFGDNVPMLSHKYEKYVPILSMNTTDECADIAIPTWEDWRRATYLRDGKMFPKDFQTYESLDKFDSISWDEKIPTAIWRGASTGLGTTESDNIRLFMYKYGQRGEMDTDGNLFVNVGINKWNLRPRKHKNNPYLRTILKEDFDMVKSPYMSPLEQAKYKYILHLPGHTCAYRLGTELFSGSVVLLYPCPNKLWFFDMIKPWVHYVPIEKEFDEEEIKNKIRWCKENDEKCREIVKNAREFADTHLTLDGILNFLQKLLSSISKNNKIDYCNETLHSLQLSRWNENIEKYQSQYLNQFPRDFYEKGIWCHQKQYLTYYFHQLNIDGKLETFMKQSLKQSNIINSKKTTINLYEYNNVYWVEKVIHHNWKRDDLHQIYVGTNYINSLRDTIPNFIYTYYYKIESDKTRLFIEYVPSTTLEKMIREQVVQKKDRFRLYDLMCIWTSICLALQTAQNRCGFVHMDLYPWNVLIKQKTQKVSYQNLGFETKFKYQPILIDYGNCHISENGFHYYNTTPFQLSSFSDVMCCIISSLDVFLSKVTIDDDEKRLLHKIMDFLLSFRIFEKYNMKGLRDVKIFLKEHKKFSKMLSSAHCFEKKQPIDFVNYMMKRKCYKFEDLQSLKVRRTMVQPLHSFQYYYDNVLFLEEMTRQKFPMEDVFHLSRRLFSTFRNMVQNLQYSNIQQNQYYNNHIHQFLSLFNSYIQKIQKHYKKNVWNGINFNDILADLLFECPLNNDVMKQSIEYIRNYENTMTTPKVPILKTHLCKKCQDGKTTTTKEYWFHLQLVQFSKENFNFFDTINQNF